MPCPPVTGKHVEADVVPCRPRRQGRARLMLTTRIKVNKRVFRRPILVAVDEREAAFNSWPPPQPWGPPTAGQRSTPHRRRPWRIVYWVTFGLLCAATVGLIVGVFMTLRTARWSSSSSMAPTIQPGSLLVYQPGATGIVRGDVVILQVPGVGLAAHRGPRLRGIRVPRPVHAADAGDVHGRRSRAGRSPHPPPGGAAGPRHLRHPGGDRAGSGGHHRVGSPSPTQAARAVTADGLVSQPLCWLIW
jgi:hypothetical protein